jgi:hypothetical protein
MRARTSNNKMQLTRSALTMAALAANLVVRRVAWKSLQWQFCSEDTPASRAAIMASLRGHTTNLPMAGVVACDNRGC